MSSSDIDALTLPHMRHGTGRVIATRLNVRSAPGTTAPVVGVLGNGEAVDVWTREAGWLIVQNAAGLTGWVAADWLRLDGELVP